MGYAYADRGCLLNETVIYSSLVDRSGVGKSKLFFFLFYFAGILVLFAVT